MKKTREDQEVRDLEELFERYRQAPESYVFVPLADACRKMGRIDEALEICESGVRRHPAYPSGHVVKGKCLFDKGDPVGARDTFERVLMLDENNLVALKYLGMIEADAGDLSAAQRHFRHILSLDPDNKEIKTILGIVAEQEQPAETTEPTSVDVMAGVDEILRGSAEGDSSSAERESASDVVAEAAASAEETAPKRRGDELETSDELASVTLAEIFASQGYRSKAEKIYREVLRRQPENEDVRKRLRDLAPGESNTDDQKENDGFEVMARVSETRPELVDSPPFEDRAPYGGTSGEGCSGPSSPAAPDPPAQAPPDRPDLGTEARLGEPRAEISEKDSLGHFKRWLTRMQK